MAPLELSLVAIFAILAICLEVHRRKLRLRVNQLREEILQKEQLISRQDTQLQTFSDFSQMSRELQEFRNLVTMGLKSSEKESYALQKQVDLLIDAQANTQNIAAELVSTLRGNVQAKGKWGELVLERLLESAGLQEGRDFVREGRGLKLRNDAGQSRRPDVVVKLPGDRCLVIDAKVNLAALDTAPSHGEGEVGGDGCASVATRGTHPGNQAFLRALKQQIQDLQTKEYDQLPGLKSPDFVLLFIPIERAYLLVQEESPALLEKAAREGILLCGPGSLLSTLKMVSYVWKEERADQNQKEILLRAGRLHDKFIGSLEELRSVGLALRQAQQAQERLLKKWSEGQGSLLRQTEELRKLGAYTKKSCPSEFAPGVATAAAHEEPTFPI